jgi:diacylglycerol kinase family enzyme
MKILFILNPNSGAKTNDTAVLRIHELTIEHDLDPGFLYTKGDSDDQRIQHALEQFKPERVVAAGGDGTVQLVARNLLHRNLPMGILPLGSANGMATAAGIPSDDAQATDVAVTSKKLKLLDVLKFNDKHLCVHMGDVGTNALMVKKYGQENSKGMLGYAKHLISSIKESPLLQFTINTSEGEFKKEGYLLAFANGHKYGTGVNISEGRAWDGKFEICNVTELALNKVTTASLTLLNVVLDREMFTDVISCRHADVRINQKVPFQIDGEYMGDVDHLRVEIIPSAVKLIVP